METCHTKSVDETMLLAAELAKQARGGGVYAFFGGMGMGKTAFIKGFVKGMGNSSDVSSPTFALVNDYGGDPHIYHFDMYRVESWDDLCSTGFFDYMDGDSILLIEWSENIEAALPDDAVRITISMGESENERVISIDN